MSEYEPLNALTLPHGESLHRGIIGHGEKDGIRHGVRALQQALSGLTNERGDSYMDEVSSHGTFGPHTEISLRAFQKDHGMNPSGVLDSATVDMINLAISHHNKAAMEKAQHAVKAAALFVAPKPDSHEGGSSKPHEHNPRHHEHHHPHGHHEHKPDPIFAHFSPEVGHAIRLAANNNHVSAHALATFAMIESSGDPMQGKAERDTAKAHGKDFPGSAGLFQFQLATAHGMGLSDDDRFDPIKSADAAAKLYSVHKHSLEKLLGREPKPAEIYLAHQQGLAGTEALINADKNHPQQLATDTVSPSHVLQNGGVKTMTAGDFVRYWEDRYERVSEGKGVISGEEFLHMENARKAAAAANIAVQHHHAPDTLSTPTAGKKPDSPSITHS